MKNDYTGLLLGIINSKGGFFMKVERYVGGKKLSLDQIKKYTVKNKTVDMMFERVVKREGR